MREEERGRIFGHPVALASGSGASISGSIRLLHSLVSSFAPPLVSEALDRIQQISHDSSVNVLIVEQKVREVLKIAQRVYVLRNGKVSFTGPAADLQDDQRLKQVYL